MPEHTPILPNISTTQVSAEYKPISAQNSHAQDRDIYKEFLRGVPVQRKLSVGAADDPLEDEADAMADKIMRMPESSFIQRKCAHCEQEEENAQRKPLSSFIQKKEIHGGSVIQRQEENSLKLDESFKLKTTPPEPDYLSLKTPFLERNALHLWDPDAALGVWRYNYRFFKMTGLSDSMAGKAANLTAPFAIDAQLKAGNPKLWELSDKDLNTTSLVGSAPVFSFDSNFKNWKFLPFLRKKSENDLNETNNQNFIQRKCAHCEEEEKAQRKPLAPFIQKKESINNNAVSDVVYNKIQSTKNSGIPMPEQTKSFMESRFDADFSNVNIHTGSYAAQLSNQLNAQAFTVGHDIYFNEGKYSPESNAGRHLLAHELTHTIQQSGLQKKSIIQKQQAPAPQIPTTPQPAPALPGSDVMTIIEAQVAIDNYNIQLREAVLAPLFAPRPDGITFLNRVRSVTPAQADILAADDQFLSRVRTVLPGRNLWTVFTLLHFHNNIREPHLRLKLAVLQHDARLLADMLSLVILTYHIDRYYTILREVVNVEFAGDPLLNEILRLIDHRNDPGISQRETATYQEAHYEQNAAGTYALTSFTGNVSANSYFSGNELRVIVKMLFLDGNDVTACPNTPAAGCRPFYFPGTYNDKYTSWLNKIKEVWNGRFHISNSRNSYDIVFVPVFLSEPDADATRIRAMTNTALRCNPSSQPGRSEQTCWFMNVPLSVVAHEFGHIIGASDEYNLPGSNQEIINAGITGMSVQDMTLSSMQGVTGSPQAPNPNRTANTTNSLMGNNYASTAVHTRHLTRLMGLLNAGLAPGTPQFTIFAGRRRR